MIRSALKRGIKKVLGMEGGEVRATPPPPAWKAEAKVETPKVETPAVEAPKVEVAPAAPVAETAAPQKPEQKAWVPPTDEPIPGKPLPVSKEGIAIETKAEPKAKPGSASVAAKVVEPTDDTAGKALSMEAVQEIMDEMVRPALQGDGGDITLIKVENNDIFVKLVGSCSTCPSSIMTMKMGVEALLKEEFPAMGSLIQVD